MKDLIIGILLGIFIAGTSAGAVEIAFSKITVQDMYRGFAIAGLLASNRNYGIEGTIAAAVNYADALYARRDK